MTRPNELTVPKRWSSEAGKNKAARAKSFHWKENMTGYLFLLPCLVIFSIFLFYPLFQSIYLSFHMTDPQGRVAGWVGLDNFTQLFTTDKFLNNLKVTMQFVLYTVPAAIVWALILAAFTHHKLKGMSMFQFIFSLPIAISAGTGAVIWTQLFHPTTGMLNYFLSKVGIDPVFWLSDPAWALISVSIVTVWMNLGFNYIVLLSGFQSIPQDIYDSAKIDGAGPVRSFWSLLLPLLSPTLFFVLVVSVIGAFQTFAQIHIMTKGGPMNMTNVVVYQIYQDAFVNYRFGEGSAQALVLFAIILILTMLQFKVLEKKVHYQ
ncbi:carbohydrate ABC transporter permease [Marinicrinis lubricantis]|uniref:Carbohydrate ABC transporter permease n=1 Tax=Marinicrinis lubricantis TaxID=2086470 RepID=A0ABW1IS22_9BACL